VLLGQLLRERFLRRRLLLQLELHRHLSGVLGFDRRFVQRHMHDVLLGQRGVAFLFAVRVQRRRELPDDVCFRLELRVRLLLFRIDVHRQVCERQRVLGGRPVHLRVLRRRLLLQSSVHQRMSDVLLLQGCERERHVHHTRFGQHRRPERHVQSLFVWRCDDVSNELCERRELRERLLLQRHRLHCEAGERQQLQRERSVYER